MGLTIRRGTLGRAAFTFRTWRAWGWTGPWCLLLLLLVFALSLVLLFRPGLWTTSVWIIGIIISISCTEKCFRDMIHTFFCSLTVPHKVLPGFLGKGRRRRWGIPQICTQTSLQMGMSQNEVSFFTLRVNLVNQKKDTSVWDIPKLFWGSQSRIK